MTIRIRLNDDPNTWGTDGDQAVATRAAEIMRDRLEPLLAEEYPEATIDIDIQPTETPDAIRCYTGSYRDEDAEGNVFETINALHADVLSEVLAEQHDTSTEQCAECGRDLTTIADYDGLCGDCAKQVRHALEQLYPGEKAI